MSLVVIESLKNLFQVVTLEAEVAKLKSQIEELQMKLAESEKELVSCRIFNPLIPF